MKKWFLILICALFNLWLHQSFAYFTDHELQSVDSFIDSVNVDELDSVEWDNSRYCEQVYLEANRRREFTQDELEKCRDIFSIKNEEEINYMKYVIWERWIYY